MATSSEELNLKFYSILISLNIKSISKILAIIKKDGQALENIWRN
jgi:hypothetical protein